MTKVYTTEELNFTSEDEKKILKDCKFGEKIADACEKLAVNYLTADKWKPVRDMAFIRELPVEQTGLIISPVDLNRSRENTPILKGIVEAIGPKVTDFKVGDTVHFEIDAGEFRLPWDDPVRIMYEGQVMYVESPDDVWEEAFATRGILSPEDFNFKNQYEGSWDVEKYKHRNDDGSCPYCGHTGWTMADICLRIGKCRLCHKEFYV